MREDLLRSDPQGIIIKTIQECSEVILTLTKLQTFGNVATDPKTNITYDNIKDVLDEVKDVEHAVSKLRKILDYKTNCKLETGEMM